MKGNEPKVPGLTREEIDRIMDPQLSVEDRMTAWQARSLNAQARKLLQQLNSDAMRRHYLTGQTCLVITLFLWLLTPFLPSSSQIFDMRALSLCLYVIALSALVFGLLQAWAMTRSVTRIEKI